jgi:hypothetical protein
MSSLYFFCRSIPLHNRFHSPLRMERLCLMNLMPQNSSVGQKGHSGITDVMMLLLTIAYVAAYLSIGRERE